MLRIIGGLFAATSMVYLYLSDSAIWTSLWPESFHGRVVNLFGGTMKAGVTGDLRVDLSWPGVLLRLTGILVTGGVLRAVVLHWREHRPGPEGANVAVQPVERRRRPSTAAMLVESLDQIGRVWLWCLLWLSVWLTAELQPTSVTAAFLYLTPMFWSAVITSATVCSVLLPRCPAEVPRTSAGSRIPAILLSLLTLTWIAVSFWMNERLYAGLWIPHGDSAMYEEHLWNVWHGKGFRSYLDQGLFLGEHIQVIHLLLLPLHILWPSHLLLELAESVALGICVVPIYRMTLRYTESPVAAAFLGATWLFYFPMHFLDIAIDLKTLRPSCYGLPFLLWGIDLAERHRLKWATFCLLIAMSAQEDFALIIGPVGLVLWYQQRMKQSDDPLAGSTARWALWVGVLSFVYLLLVVLVIIPAFRSGAVVHYSRYFGDLGNSPGDLVRTALRDPLRVLGQIVTMRTLIYLLVFSVPMGFLCVRSPVRLLAGVATFTMLSLIQLGNGAAPDSGTDTNQGSVVVAAELPPIPYHHFHAPLLPVLFWAAAAGTGGARKGKAAGRIGTSVTGRRFSPEATACFACGCAVFTAVSGSMMPTGASFWSPESRSSWQKLYVPGARAHQFEKILPLLPQQSRVASTDYVHTRLTHFERSYDYSGYLRAVNNYQPGVPEDTDYIVIDTQHPYSEVRSSADVRELRENPDDWELLPDTTDGFFIVLKRRR